MRFPDAPLAWTVEGIYTADECATIVKQIDTAAPTIATNNPMYRDQDRVIRDDAEFATDLFRRLGPHLPPTIGPLRLSGLNERLRFYRYRSGQSFAPHMDHWYQPSPRRITLLTVLVYLSEGFEGGETRLMEQLDQVIVPRCGLVAIFQHKIRHEGCRVQRGTKYAMRTDVIYEAPSTIELTFDALA